MSRGPHSTTAATHAQCGRCANSLQPLAGTRQLDCGMGGRGAWRSGRILHAARLCRWAFRLRVRGPWRGGYDPIPLPWYARGHRLVVIAARALAFDGSRRQTCCVTQHTIRGACFPPTDRSCMEQHFNTHVQERSTKIHRLRDHIINYVPVYSPSPQGCE